METSQVSRRQLIQGTFMGSGFALLFSRLGKAASCALTPSQMEGPYYPESDLNRDNDLTRLLPTLPRAEGQVIYLSGKVMDPGCNPITGALVEIWQAAYSGKYNHSEDPNDLPLDPGFQYWGRCRTNAEGRYDFVTIVPGHYPVGPNQYRPPHIHFKAHAAGFFSLTTQMYFDPMSYDDIPLQALVAKLNRLENVDPRLTVLFTPTVLEPGAKQGSFDLTLRKNR